MRGIAPVLEELVAARIKTATTPLLARIAELEGRPAVSWQGEFQPGRSYLRGQSASFGGNIYTAQGATRSAPGTDATWRLTSGKLAAAVDKLLTPRLREIADRGLLYRGIWKDGPHIAGDVCTRGGSAWHCQRDTSGMPGDSPDWVLMVKKGADGKDAGTRK